MLAINNKIVILEKAVQESLDEFPAFTTEKLEKLTLALTNLSSESISQILATVSSKTYVGQFADSYRSRIYRALVAGDVKPLLTNPYSYFTEICNLDEAEIVTTSSLWKKACLHIQVRFDNLLLEPFLGEFIFYNWSYSSKNVYSITKDISLSVETRNDMLICLKIDTGVKDEPDCGCKSKPVEMDKCTEIGDLSKILATKNAAWLLSLSEEICEKLRQVFQTEIKIVNI